MTQLEIEMNDAIPGEPPSVIKAALAVARRHVTVERHLCASVVARAAHRWPDNPHVRAVLESLAEELREGLRG